MIINSDGTCTYRGQTYATLRGGLLAAGLPLRQSDEAEADKISG